MEILCGISLPSTVTNTLEEWQDTSFRDKPALFTHLSRGELYVRLTQVTSLQIDFDETMSRGKSYWRKMEEDLGKTNPDLLNVTFAHMGHCLRMDPHDHDSWRRFAKEPFRPELMDLMHEVDAATWTMHMFFYQLFGKDVRYLRELAKRVVLREGIDAFMQTFPIHRITSSGYAALVNLICRNHGIEPFDVAAFELIFEQDFMRGKIIGIKPGTMLTGHLKEASTHAFLGAHCLETSQLLAIGDSYWDFPMMTVDGLGILIVDPDRLNNRLVQLTLKHLASEWGKRVDIVLFARDYHELVKLIRKAKDS